MARELGKRWLKKIQNKNNNKPKRAKQIIDIYTSLDDFKKPKNTKRFKFVVHQFDGINSDFKEWIFETTAKLLENHTESEKIFEDMLMYNKVPFEKQVFFKIGKNCYFLDFYVPQCFLAIEIDGGVHKKTKLYDKKRDSDFKLIGIRTVRIKNSKVSTTNISQLINN